MPREISGNFDFSFRAWLSKREGVRSTARDEVDPSLGATQHSSRDDRRPAKRE